MSVTDDPVGCEEEEDDGEEDEDEDGMEEDEDDGQSVTFVVTQLLEPRTVQR